MRLLRWDCLARRRPRWSFDQDRGQRVNYNSKLLLGRVKWRNGFSLFLNRLDSHFHFQPNRYHILFREGYGLGEGQDLGCQLGEPLPLLIHRFSFTSLSNAAEADGLPNAWPIAHRAAAWPTKWPQAFASRSA